jgi:hypothetical protein
MGPNIREERPALAREPAVLSRIRIARLPAGFFPEGEGVRENFEFEGSKSRANG